MTLECPHMTGNSVCTVCQELHESQQVVNELSMLVRRLVRHSQRTDWLSASDLPDEAMDYLERKQLVENISRDDNEETHP